MSTIKQLQLFVRVARRLSLSKAAADLAVPQSTATRWLTDLEEEYGAQLIVRSTRQMRLSEAGEKFVQYAVDLIEREEMIRAGLSPLRKGGQIKLTIGAAGGFGTWVVLPTVIEFQKRNPEITVDLRLTETFVDVVAEGLDFAIRIGALDDSRLIAKKLGSLREIMVCRADIAAHIDKNSPSDVERLPWLRLSALRRGAEVEIRRRGTSRKMNVEPRLMIDTVVGLREALLLGGGVSLIHRYAVESDIAEGKLIQLLPDWSLPPWPVSAIRVAGRPQPCAAAFLAHLQQVMLGL
jgi:DNA-binding transcriptional LysR family regulator